MFLSLFRARLFPTGAIPMKHMTLSQKMVISSEFTGFLMEEDVQKTGGIYFIMKGIMPKERFLDVLIAAGQL